MEANVNVVVHTEHIRRRVATWPERRAIARRAIKSLHAWLLIGIIPPTAPDRSIRARYAKQRRREETGVWVVRHRIEMPHCHIA